MACGAENTAMTINKHSVKLCACAVTLIDCSCITVASLSSYAAKRRLENVDEEWEDGELCGEAFVCDVDGIHN